MSEKVTLPLSIIIAGLLIGGGVYYNGKMVKEVPTPAQQQEALAKGIANAIRAIDANDHILGSADAQIVIVEYSDPECPYCKMFYSTMLSIMQEYGQKEQVAWVYRHFPIKELYDRSFKEAVAQECAFALGGNSKFWEYTNELYKITPSDNRLEPSQLTTIAVDVGLSSENFSVCLESGEFEPRVQMDINNAQELNISGSPHSFLIDTKTGDHYPLEGAYPYATLKQVIDLILSQ